MTATTTTTMMTAMIATQTSVSFFSMCKGHGFEFCSCYLKARVLVETTLLHHLFYLQRVGMLLVMFSE